MIRMGSNTVTTRAHQERAIRSRHMNGVSYPARPIAGTNNTIAIRILTSSTDAVRPRAERIDAGEGMATAPLLLGDNRPNRRRRDGGIN